MSWFGRSGAALVLLCCSCAATAVRSSPAPTLPTKPAAAEPSSSPASEDPVLGLTDDPAAFRPGIRTVATLGGPKRASVFGETETLLSALPMLGEERDVGPSDRGSFALTPNGEGYRLLIQNDLLAEVDVGGFRAFTWARAGAQAAATNARRFVRVRDLRCGDPKLPIEPARVRGFHMHGWTESSLRYVEFASEYDGAKCRGVSKSVAEVEAAAVWPGVVYAFVSKSSEGAKARYLHVISPATAWVTTAPTPPDEQLNPHRGSFGYARIPLDEGAATVVLGLSDLEVGTFLALRTHQGNAAPVKSAYPIDVPAVRVVIDVDVDPGGDGQLRTRIEQIFPSHAVEETLKTLGKAVPAVSQADALSMMIGVTPQRPRPAPQVAPPRRTCGCDPNDPLCPCL